MSGPKYYVRDDLYTLSASAADAFATAAYMAQNEDRFAWIAVSGGSTPKRLFQTLASPLFRAEIPWAHVQICQVDERPVPANHPDSNFRLLKASLLDRVPIPPGNIHRIRTELGQEGAALAYEAELRAGMPEGRFDLIFLGMGDDGHTASLFPNTPGLDERDRWVIANPVEKLGVERITLTFPVINAAREIDFLVAGRSKAQRIAEVFSGGGSVRELPVLGVQPTDGSVTWLLDGEAASKLPGRDP